MKKFNVLFINHFPGVSGAERVLLRLLNSFDRNTVSPIVICPEKGSLAEQVSALNIPVKLIPMPLLIRTYSLGKLFKYAAAFFRFAWLLRQELKRTRIDVIHCNTFTATLYSILPAWLTNTPLLWHMHDILQQRTFNRIFIRLAATRADKIICVSHAVRESLIKFGVAKAKCQVIYNAVPHKIKNSNASGEFRREIGTSGDTKIVAMIGQITEGKGQDVFIKAATVVKKKYSNLKCVIVGDIISASAQAYKGLVRKMVSSYGLEDVVVFTGFRSDIMPIIADCDVVVHASVKPDSLPTVIIEAMAAGKPIIASSVGGVAEMVEDGVNGFIIPPGDADKLASAIMKLLDDPRLLQTMGNRGKHIAEKKFNRDIQVAQILKIYRDFT